MAKEEFKFISLGSHRSKSSYFPSNPVPSVLIRESVTTVTLAMTLDVYESLEKPSWVSVSADPVHDVLRIVKLASGDSRPDGRTGGVRRIRYNSYSHPEDGSHTEGYYSVRIGGKKAGMVERVKKGYYLPIGGGIFKYHGANPPTH